jgi:ABC-type molybdenum transport system ATPase subunit/photorepair protein PhrA
MRPIPSGGPAPGNASRAPAEFALSAPGFRSAAVLDRQPPMSVLNAQNLHKSFGARTLFDGVSFAIDEGEKVGFIGANASGMTPLLALEVRRSSSC